MAVIPQFFEEGRDIGFSQETAFRRIAAAVGQRYRDTLHARFPFGNAAPYPIIDPVLLALPTFATWRLEPVRMNLRIDTHDPNLRAAKSPNAYFLKGRIHRFPPIKIGGKRQGQEPLIPRALNL